MGSGAEGTGSGFALRTAAEAGVIRRLGADQAIRVDRRPATVVTWRQRVEGQLCRIRFEPAALRAGDAPRPFEYVELYASDPRIVIAAETVA